MYHLKEALIEKAIKNGANPDKEWLSDPA